MGKTRFSILLLCKSMEKHVLPIFFFWFEMKFTTPMYKKNNQYLFYKFLQVSNKQVKNGLSTKSSGRLQPVGSHFTHVHRVLADGHQVQPAVHEARFQHYDVR